MVAGRGNGRYYSKLEGGLRRDGKGGGILSAMFMQTEVPACADAGDCPWYWTKSDSDQDRPN